MTQPVSPADFRAALGSFASGVTVVTLIRPDGGYHGVTVSSLASLSLEPPLITFALSNDGESLPFLQRTTRFVVNILSDAQEQASRHFAKSGHGWVDITPFEPDDAGVPVFRDAVASLSCQIEQTITLGDHTLIVGRVTKTNAHTQARPLLYFRGKYQFLA